MAEGTGAQGTFNTCTNGTGAQVAFDAGPKAEFPQVFKIKPCSSNECTNGHTWAPQLLLQQCPGCGAPILLVRMINCPICNEDVKTFRLRTDHTNQGYGIAMICRGQKGMAESNLIEMQRHHSDDCIANW